jgi:hypothetical protein
MGRKQIQGFLILESHFYLSQQARELEQINKKNKYFLQNYVVFAARVILSKLVSSESRCRLEIQNKI